MQQKVIIKNDCCKIKDDEEVKSRLFIVVENKSL